MLYVSAAILSIGIYGKVTESHIDLHHHNVMSSFGKRIMVTFGSNVEIFLVLTI